MANNGAAAEDERETGDDGKTERKGGNPPRRRRLHLLRRTLGSFRVESSGHGFLYIEASNRAAADAAAAASPPLPPFLPIFLFLSSPGISQADRWSRAPEIFIERRAERGATERQSVTTCFQFAIYPRVLHSRVLFVLSCVCKRARVSRCMLHVYTRLFATQTSTCFLSPLVILAIMSERRDRSKATNADFANAARRQWNAIFAFRLSSHWARLEMTRWRAWIVLDISSITYITLTMNVCWHMCDTIFIFKTTRVQYMSSFITSVNLTVIWKKHFIFVIIFNFFHI